MKKFRYITSLLLMFSTFFPQSFAQKNQYPVPKTISVTIPFGVGGGTDVWARFISPHLSKYLSNAPTIVIKNVPGGGSITGTNLFYSRAKHNGSEMIGISASTLFPYMLGDIRVRYNFDNWQPIFASPTGGVVYIQPNLGISTADEIEKLGNQPLLFTAQGATQLELPVMLALDMLKLNLKPVFGMTSRGEGRLAFERGEAQLDFQTTSAYINSVQDLIDNNKAIPLFSLGILNENGDTIRDPAFANIPTFQEVYVSRFGKQPEGMQYEAYKKFLTAGFSLQKVFLIPNNTPQPIVNEINIAIHQMIEDNLFQKDAVDHIGPYKNLTGTTVSKHLQEAITMSPELQEWVKNWLYEKYNIAIN